VYQSLDLDFVVTFRRTTRDVGKILVPLGFGLRGQTFHHDVNRFTIDFPKGPLMVGADRIERWDTVRRNDETLNVLSRTDCVRDRDGLRCRRRRRRRLRRHPRGERT
jgi:hypothetical protein